MRRSYRFEYVMVQVASVPEELTIVDNDLHCEFISFKFAANSFHEDGDYIEEDLGAGGFDVLAGDHFGLSEVVEFIDHVEDLRDHLVDVIAALFLVVALGEGVVGVESRADLLCSYLLVGSGEFGIRVGTSVLHGYYKFRLFWLQNSKNGNRLPYRRRIR